MCSNEQDLHRRAGWDGKGAVSRQKLMDRLQCKSMGYLVSEETVYCIGGNVKH